MIIVSVETAIAMKCNFVTETDIKKKNLDSTPMHHLQNWILSHYSHLIPDQIDIDVIRMILYGL